MQISDNIITKNSNSPFRFDNEEREPSLPEANGNYDPKLDALLLGNLSSPATTWLPQFTDNTCAQHIRAKSNSILAGKSPGIPGLLKDIAFPRFSACIVLRTEPFFPRSVWRTLSSLSPRKRTSDFSKEVQQETRENIVRHARLWLSFPLRKVKIIVGAQLRDIAHSVMKDIFIGWLFGFIAIKRT